MNKNYHNILDSVAGLYIHDDLDLFDRVQAKLGQRRTLMQTMRARPALAMLLAILALLVLTGVAYAIGRSLGYIPGVGFVQPASLRVLAEPVHQTREGVTVTIEQVVVDPERTVVVYKAEGLSLRAANSRGEAPGITFFDNYLRLPDGILLNESIPEGYAGIPEPLINKIEAEGGWPNYVRRLVYPFVDSQINELTLVIPALENMPAGTAPENWEISFRLQPAPPDMTVVPILAITPQSQPVITGTPGVESTTVVTPATISTQNGITLSLDTVIEMEDGYVFTGSISWDPSAPGTAARVHFWETVIPTLKDGNGRDLPVEVVYLDASPEANKSPWSIRTDRKAFVGPLVFSVPSMEGVYDVPPFELSLDLGPDPQVGQTWDVKQEYHIDGHTVRLLSVQLIQPFNGCSLVALEFKFEWDVGGAFTSVTDTNPDPPGDYSCESVNGDSGQPVDSKVILSALLYKNIPTGLHHFSFISQIPYVAVGPWQVIWNSPVTSGPIPTAEPEMCLTGERWNQIIIQNEALPPGLGGKILLSVYDPNSNASFPTLQLANPDGSNLQTVVHGGWTSLSNDGRALSYNDAAGLHILDLATRQTSTVGIDGYHVIWSPDNTRMMYTATFNLFVANADGSEPRIVNTRPAQVVAPVGWLADSQTLIYASLMDAGKFGLKSHNLQTGETKDLFAIQSKSGFGALSPDGQWIVYLSQEFSPSGYDVFISRLDGSERKLIAGAEVMVTGAVWSPDGQWLILNTVSKDVRIPVLVNPFTCQALRLNAINGSVEDWSP